jgi:hypothetical protein
MQSSNASYLAGVGTAIHIGRWPVVSALENVLQAVCQLSALLCLLTKTSGPLNLTSESRESRSNAVLVLEPSRSSNAVLVLEPSLSLENERRKFRERKNRKFRKSSCSLENERRCNDFRKSFFSRESGLTRMSIVADTADPSSSTSSPHPLSSFAETLLHLLESEYGETSPLTQTHTRTRARALSLARSLFFSHTLTHSHTRARALSPSLRPTGRAVSTVSGR